MSSMSEGDRKLPDIETLRRRAVAYYKECDMQDRLQKFLNKLYLEQPDDIYGRLVSDVVLGVSFQIP